MLPPYVRITHRIYAEFIKTLQINRKSQHLCDVIVRPYFRPRALTSFKHVRQRQIRFFFFFSMSFFRTLQTVHHIHPSCTLFWSRTRYLTQSKPGRRSLGSGPRPLFPSGPEFVCFCPTNVPMTPNGPQMNRTIRGNTPGFD